MKSVLKATMVALVGIVLAAPASAACEAACKEAKAIWSTKKATKIGADTYYVATAPKNDFVLVKWKKSVKSVTFENVDAAVTAVSGCRAVDTEGYKRVQAAMGGSIPAKIFRKMKGFTIIVGNRLNSSFMLFSSSSC